MVKSIQLREINQSVVRNIVYVEPPEIAFSDLLSDKVAVEVALKAMQRVMLGNLSDFNYTAAMGHPFETDPWMATRFSDGRFPVWYGAFDSETTIHETVFQWITFLRGYEGVWQYPLLEQKRAVYAVPCQGLFIEVRKEGEVSQEVGMKYQAQGLSGLVTPSTCYPGGTILTAFRQNVLGYAKLDCYLTYRMMVSASKVQVICHQEVIEEIGFDHAD